MAWTDNSYKFPFLQEQEKRNNPKYKDVPLIVAPGKEDAYLKDKAKNEAAKVAEAERIIKEKMRQRPYKKMQNSNNRKIRSRNSQSVTTAMDGTDY